MENFRKQIKISRHTAYSVAGQMANEQKEKWDDDEEEEVEIRLNATKINTNLLLLKRIHWIASFKSERERSKTNKSFELVERI